MYILLCVAVPPKCSTPAVTYVGIWSVWVTITPPAGADTSKKLIYLIEYRKDGQTAWQSLPETGHTTVHITGLEASTIYQIKVAAKYVGGEFGPESDVVGVETRPRKCCYRLRRCRSRETCYVMLIRLSYAIDAASEIQI